MGELTDVTAPRSDPDCTSAVNDAGRLWHTIRFADGSWQPFGDVEGQTGDMGTHEGHRAIGAGPAPLLRSTRRADCGTPSDSRTASWQPFGDVEGQTGDMGELAQVAVAET